MKLHKLTRLPAVVLLGLLCLAAPEPSRAFVSNGRWTSTATQSSTGVTGAPATLTWSIVPDGTTIPGRNPSNLVAFFDGLYGAGDGGTDLQNRPWFDDLVKSSFDRWTELSGLTFKYEPNDDGAIHGNFFGLLDTRGDIRLGGTFLDGQGGTSAQAGFIPNSDITIDTGDSIFYGSTNSNSINLRNTLTHEIGHSFGLAHVDSNTSNFLLEPAYNDTFDGPQIDDIRGIHQLYGDVLERDTYGPKPNNSTATASSLGVLADGQTVALGYDAGFTTGVSPTESDFLSIANTSDIDYFTFTTVGAATVDVTITPTGPNYFERPTGVGNYAVTRSSQQSDLTLEVFRATDGGGTQLLGTANSAPLGQAESLLDLLLPAAGEYFVRVAGSTNAVQLYQLSLALEASSTAGDFDENDQVDGIDFLQWQLGFGPTYTSSHLSDWQENYGTLAGQPASQVVPEPTILCSLSLLLYTCLSSRRLSGFPQGFIGGGN
ncbi:matrixin family metalloprotease [Adhaeretor mobilis]|uniref:Matrixin n=1 Tax=Adhaeretor mobilis TaxID=1930276 RepID=A0A517MZA7_9BACT|nr:matrixin family metalloprotease [Adhaeretor mobilis]QDT00219.1 Matrixin [Adhaeretor mobilis]